MFTSPSLRRAAGLPTRRLANETAIRQDRQGPEPIHRSQRLRQATRQVGNRIPLEAGGTEESCRSELTRANGRIHHAGAPERPPAAFISALRRKIQVLVIYI